MNGAIKLLCLLLVFGLMGSALQAQTKSDLQKQRDDLSKKIEYTKKLLNETKQTKEATNHELTLLSQQISFRQQLINTIYAEIREIDNDILEKQKEIESKEQEIEAMKAEYARMVYQSYKNRGTTDKLMFIFSASDFNQGYKRLKMTQHYAEVRKNQTDAIRAHQAELADHIEQLEQIRIDKQGLADTKKEESQRLNSDVASRQSMLDKLKGEESRLHKQREQQEEERKKINAAIQRIIEEELRAEKDKNNGVFKLTPAGKIVSENFEKNKGTLPWPVTHGIITQTFGQQAHATLPGITIDNKGIDITTDKEAEVRSIFNGEVTSVFTIPGAGQNVIVTHGAYKSVYTNLKQVTVKKGDQVAAKETIGVVLSEGSKSIAHLEIWKVSSAGGTPLNPSYWISK
jgi:murein hydrolase activator